MPGDARGTRDALVAYFGKASIFMDVDNLLAGQRFDEELAKELDACELLIAIIGPRWMELLRAKLAAGEPDYVRQEIAAALKRKIVVIPVRVGREGAMPPLPRREELPDDIRDLLLYQKQDVAHERFGRDAAELVKAIIAVRRAREWDRRAGGGSSKTWLRLVGAAGLGTAVAVGGYQLWVRDVQKRQATEEAAARQGEDAPRQRADLEARADPATSVVPGSGQSFRDCANICPEMVIAPVGTFTMGSTEYDSEKPPHAVTISKPFAVGRYAITFDEWEACVVDGGCKGYTPQDGGWGRGKLPVIEVSWQDAKAYTSWLSRKSGKTYRLLSEAEREYMTRAGTTTPYWWGSLISTSEANYDGNYTYGPSPKGEYRKQTVSVDSFKPNPWGLYQVHGNVFEWCEDNWHASYQGAPVDGSVWSGGDSSLRVVRGGSWLSNPQNLRSANRLSFHPDSRGDAIGFRVARTL